MDKELVSKIINEAVALGKQGINREVLLFPVVRQKKRCNFWIRNLTIIPMLRDENDPNSQWQWTNYSLPLVSDTQLDFYTNPDLFATTAIERYWGLLGTTD